MEITWFVDPGAGLVRLRYRGEPDFNVWAGVMTAIFADPAYRPGFGFVADLTESGVPDTDHLRQVELFVRRHERQMKGSRWANVTHDIVHYGMTGVAEVFVEDLSSTIRAFTSAADAEAWASGHSPELRERPAPRDTR